MCILGASSPYLILQGSDDHAYTHSKREQLASLNPQPSFQLPALNWPTHRLSAGADLGYSAAATWNLHFDDALLVSKVSIWQSTTDILFDRIVKLHCSD